MADTRVTTVTVLLHKTIQAQQRKVLQKWRSSVRKELTQDIWAAAPASIALASPFLLLPLLGFSQPFRTGTDS